MMSGALVVRTVAAVAAVACLSLGGCKAAEQEAAVGEASATQVASPDESNREPIMLHARIDYTGATDLSSAGSSSGSHFSLELQQPAFRFGEGAHAEYEVDNDQAAQVVGSVHGYGQAHVVSDAGTLTERYDEWARWPRLAAPTQGLFSIGMPSPSDIGDGLAVQLKVHAAMDGSRTAHMQSKDVSADVDPSISIPTMCGSSSEYRSDHGEACGFDLTLDALPTAAKSAAGEVLLPTIQQGLAAPNGEWGMVGTGQLYGATTKYREHGHFVLTYRRALTLAEKDGGLSHDFKVVVWSTDRNEDWKPADLPPIESR